MQAWLMRLSGAFVVAAAGYGAYVFMQGDDGARLAQEAERLRPTINDLVGQGKVALQTLIESAQQASATSVASTPREQRLAQAQLPFVIVDPRDRNAPMALAAPQRQYREVTPALPAPV